MDTPSSTRRAVLGCALLLVLTVTLAAQAVDSAAVKRSFADPPRQYSTAPFWVWNDMLTEKHVLSTLNDLASVGIREAFVHPRPGLMTPYLGDEWFRLWGAALAEAKRLDMNLWIYDENSYPSGFAGGWVPETMPETRGRGLFLREVPAPPPAGVNPVAVFQREGDAYRDVTAAVREGKTMPEGAYLMAVVERPEPSPWYAGRCYVDLMHPAVTPAFLSITLDPYVERFGEDFSKRIPGSFTDEPQVRSVGGLPWTDDLPEQFEKRWGYRLMEHLPSLQRPVGDWRRVRHNYYQTVLDLFIERWGRPYFEYCQKHGLEFTGHYWEHDWPVCILVPDNMALAAWQQRPGIDTLMNEYAEDPHAQFGNVRAVKEICSVANQLGRPRTLCEAYGASGWDLRFEDMKRIGDWLYVLGVNTLNQHLSYVSIRGMRKRDHPPSFSYHAPWWEAYPVMAGYFARLTAALAQGEQVNRILVLEPTTTAWMYQNPEAQEKRLVELGDTFQKLVTDLEKAQVEYDLGCEDMLAHHGSVSGGTFVVDRRRYDTVVMPALTESLNRRTADLLDAFLAAGGAVYACGDPPSRVDGKESDWGGKAAASAGWKRIEPATLPAALLGTANDGFAIEPAPGKSGLLLHHRRQLDDGQIVFLVNTSLDAPAEGTLKCRAGGAEKWDPETGEVTPYPFDPVDEEHLSLAFALRPAGSLLLFLPKDRRQPVPRPMETSSALAAAGPPEIRLAASNVLTLDFVDVRAGGESLESAYVLKAAKFVFQKNGMGANPWDAAVQFKDEIIRKTFPPDSGFEATYRFEIRDRVPGALSAVIERGDLYTVTCNGRKLVVNPDQWWLDRAFTRIDIEDAAQTGWNELRIQASPMTVQHELESAYILGEFSLEPTEKGFAIVPPKPMQLGPWDRQGCPFYSAGVTYSQEFEASEGSARHVVALSKWFGAVAKVEVNGQPAGVIYRDPWECDVTAAIRPGKNRVSVTVVGTLKNTLGPHHGRPPLGRAWPGMFEASPESGPPPGADYATVGYGLFEPFVLKRITTD